MRATIANFLGWSARVNERLARWGDLRASTRLLARGWRLKARVLRRAEILIRP